MTAVVASNRMVQALEEMSQPVSQASSPASPASFLSQQIPIALPTINLNGQNRSEGSTQPGTPTFSSTSISLEPPPGMAFADYLKAWSDTHVARWLTDIKCGHHAQTFKANDIRGDVLLELDQGTLKEMGLVSVGDRIRIVAGVKALRQKCFSSSPLTSITNRPRHDHGRNGSLGNENGFVNGRSTGHRRLESGRPAPLHLSSNSNINDNLPRIIRDAPDSGRSNPPPIRPLPQPSASHNLIPVSQTSGTRSNLPPLPPPPRGQPPQPPNTRTPRSLHPPPNPVTGRRTPTQSDAPSFTNQPLPPAPNSQHLTPTIQSQGVNWPSYDLRQGSGHNRNPARSNSPLPPTPAQTRNTNNRSPNGTSNVHSRTGSYSGPATPTQTNVPKRPSTGNTHPYAQQSTLSPIHEAFNAQRTNSPTPPPSSNNQYRSIQSATRTATASNNPSLDDLRRKLIKFNLPAEGKSVTINVTDCNGGAEIIERALRKFAKLTPKPGDDTSMNVEIVDGGLSVEGWGAFLDWGQDSRGAPLSESQLLSICHAPPDEPAREHGLTLRSLSSRKGPRGSPVNTSAPSRPSGSNESLDDTVLPPGDAHPGQTPASTSMAMKRASSISVLSSLGVPVPESQGKLLSPNASPTKSPSKAGKLRNFFGQRPPSELITNHLAEYFPDAEKKVLERTRRVSMMRASGLGPANKRDSIMSFSQPSRSRFSVSTQGSQLASSPRNSIASAAALSTKPPSPEPFEQLQVDEEPPRVSISTEDGPPAEVTPEDVTDKPKASKRRSVMLLPPVAFPSESLSESMNLVEQPAPKSRPVSRTLSSGPMGKRMSYITELRSKRDKSDTASLMTVDEITAEVENRRASMESRRDSATKSSDWTKVDVDETDQESIKEVPEEDEEESEDEDQSEESEDVSDITVTDEEEDDQAKAITSHGERTIKWIRGALIGAGSFGKVYLGMDASAGLLMAVKQVELPTGSAPNEERKKSMLNALEREIELLKDLHHENIVQYLSSCIDEDHLNIFLEYVPGGSVASLLRNYGAFEEPLVRNWVRQILLGLNYLHERDIIHRDIKGANMLVDNKGGIKISDFGISKKVEENLLPGNRAHRPSLQGSVFWMAPEVVKQTAYTQKADIWSVGCLVVEMLTGEHPWAQLTQMQAIFKIGSSAKPTIPSDISPEAVDFLEKTFELDHEARPTAAELLKHPWIANQTSPLGH